MANYWKYISNAYDRLDEASRGIVEAYWAAAEYVVGQRFGDFFAAMSMLSINSIVGVVREYNVLIDNTAALPVDIVSIPFLVDNLASPTQKLVYDVDFIIDPDERRIEALNGPTAVEYKAPWVERQNPEIWEYAALIKLNRDAVASWSFDRVIDAVKVGLKMMTCGVSYTNLSGCVAVFAGIPYAKTSGEIIETSHDGTNAIVVVAGSSGNVSHLFPCTVGEFSNVASGYVVQFQPLLSGSVDVTETDPVSDLRTIESYAVSVQNPTDLSVIGAHDIESGDIINITNVITGAHEFAKVASVSGSTVVLLTELSVKYSGADLVLIKRAAMKRNQILNTNQVDVNLAYSALVPADITNKALADILKRSGNPRVQINLNLV